MGIIAQRHVSTTIIAFLIISCATIALLYLYNGKVQTSKTILIIICAFSLGSLRYALQQNQYESFYTLTQENLFSLKGTIIDIEEMPHNLMRTQITLALDKIRPKDNVWQKYTGNLYIYTSYADTLKIDDYICMHTVYCKKTTNNSFANYMIKKGVAGCIFTQKLNYNTLNHATNSWRNWIYTTKKHLFKKCIKKLNSNTSSLFASLFLGNKNSHKKKLEPMTHQFKMWGLSHYLARSGLHLVIFILLWHMLLSLVPIAFAFKQVILLICTFLYATLSWSSISFIRALSTFILFKICILNKRHGHIAHLLTLVCFITLIINPMQLFFLDFQLSFSLTFSLTWFNYILQKK